MFFLLEKTSSSKFQLVFSLEKLIQNFISSSKIQNFQTVFCRFEEKWEWWREMIWKKIRERIKIKSKNQMKFENIKEFKTPHFKLDTNLGFSLTILSFVVTFYKSMVILVNINSI